MKLTSSELDILKINRRTSLLQKAHDLLDDANAKDPYFRSVSVHCLWCKGRGYDGYGLIHTTDCILVLIRKELSV